MMDCHHAPPAHIVDCAVDIDIATPFIGRADDVWLNPRCVKLDSIINALGPPRDTPTLLRAADANEQRALLQVFRI